jgi:hypothetical protein
MLWRGFSMSREIAQQHPARAGAQRKQGWARRSDMW